jgi:hypothetical protein
LISAALREILVWADGEGEIADPSPASLMRRNIKLGFERVEEGPRRAASKAGAENPGNEKKIDTRAIQRF